MENANSARGGQFSILGLLLITTIIGIIAGALEAARPTLQGPSPPDFGPASPLAIQLRGIVVAVAVVLSCMGGLFMVLRPGPMWVRLIAVVTLIPAFALYLAHLSAASNTYIGLTSTSLLIPTAVSLGCALGATAAFSGLCVLPLRYAGFRLRRQRKTSAELAGGREESFAITKRVAAIVSLCIALGLLPVGDRLFADRTAYSGRVNINSIQLAGWFAPSSDDQTPINAMAQWINPNIRWMKLLLCSNNSRPVFSQSNWLTFPLNKAQGSVRLSTGTAPEGEKNDGHPQDQP